MRSKLALSAVALCLLVVLAGCSRAGDPSPTQVDKGPANQTESFLFVMQATGGTLSSEDPLQKTYTLTLKNPDPAVVFLSDRPKRLVGHVPLQLFVQGWNVMGFAEQPPNAAAIVSSTTAREETVVIELARPEWNGGDGSLTFQARMVQTDRNPEAAFSTPFSNSRLPASFGHLSLFIDPSKNRAIEFIVTPNGVIELREHYADKGVHPIDVIPEMSYIGPNYFNAAGAPPTPTPQATGSTGRAR